MEKDASILELLAQLEHALGHEGFRVADRWEADRFAIGIASPTDANVVVYISTWKCAPGRFYYECELGKQIAGSDDVPYEVADEGDDVSFDVLVAAVRSHFQSTPK